MHKEIVKIIDESVVGELLPIDPRIKIEHLLIGSELQYYSYNESIRTDGFGNVSGGGTATRKYRSYDFGFGVENTADTSMRVQFTIAQIDKDGYTTKEYFPWVDVNPKEKKRVWANMFVTQKYEFQFYRIMEIGVAQSPTDGGTATCSVLTSPKKSIYDIFDLKNNSLVQNTQSSKYAWGVIIIFALIAFIKFVIL